MLSYKQEEKNGNLFTDKVHGGGGGMERKC